MILVKKCNVCGFMSKTVPNHHEDCRIRSSREVNQVTEQIKTPRIQRAEKPDSPVTVYRHDHPQSKDRRSCHKCRKINSTSQKVQQITEVSKQHYMNVELPAEMQCSEVQYQNTTTQHNKFHSLTGRSEHREGCTDAKTSADDPEDAK